MELHQVRHQSRSRVLLSLISSHQNTLRHHLLFQHYKCQSIQKIERKYLLSRINQDYQFKRTQPIPPDHSSSASSIDSIYNLNSQNQPKVRQKQRRYFFQNQIPVSPRHLKAKLKKALSLSFIQDKTEHPPRTEPKRKTEARKETKTTKPISQLNTDLMKLANKQQLQTQYLQLGGCSPLGQKLTNFQRRTRQDPLSNFKSAGKMKVSTQFSPENIVDKRIRTSQNQKNTPNTAKAMHKKKLSLKFLKLLKAGIGSQTSRN